MVAMKRFLFASFLVGFVSVGAVGQVTVFSDNFNSSTGSSYTTSAGAIGSSATWSLALSGSDWGGRIDGGYLDLSNDAGATANANGWCFGYTPTASFTAPYTTTLSSNIGVVTWTFNMRQPRTDPAGFGSGNYGVAFVLGGTNSSPNTSGDGYAVVLGQTGSTDPVRLARFTTGLQGALTDIITSNTSGLTDFGQEYLSIKVTYTPSTNTWELFLRNDGSSAFVDPTTGTLTSQGALADATYTGVALDYLGGYWQGSTAVTQTAYFDNVTVSVTYPNTITTGVVSAPPFLLANCAATAVGTVAFTSTDVFTGTNVFTAQLSDDIGSFASPVAIGNSGVLTGTAPGGTINITIPAGTVSGTGYMIRVVSDQPAIIGSSSAAFTITQSGFCASSHTDYYRSITSGDWDDPLTWESSPDNATWISPATLAPTFNANTILVRNGHTVTIASPSTADQLTVESGGVLNHSAGVSFTLNDASGSDMIVNSGGIYVLNGTQPTGSGTVEILSGGIVRVDANGSSNEADDFAYGNANVTFRTGSVFDWNTNLYTPEWSGRIYFTNTESPTFRFSQSPNFSLGGATLTIIYGILEANQPIVIVGAGTKTFTNGIIGSSTIDASAASSGALIINGTTASLGGGTLTLQSGVPLQITGCTATMTSSKTITGDITFSGSSKIILGNFDLTVSGSIAGYGPTVYVQTDGTGYLKMDAVSGTRVFPVGYSNLNAVYINNGGGSNYSVRVEDGINPGVLYLTYGINRTWNIFANAVTSGVQASFWYYTADANAGVIPGTDDMEVLLYSGSAWSITPGNNAITPTGSNPWLVTTVAVTGNLTINTTAVPYIVGKSGGWVLPIDCIISTRAQKRNNTGIISWTVNSCADVSSFEVQRSTGNGNYQTIGTVAPVANQTDFNFTDLSLARGTNLYRIKVNRVAGGTKYSNTVALIYDSNDLLITSVAPNPAQDVATLTLSTAHPGGATFNVYDVSGNMVKQWQANIAEGNNTIELNVSSLPAGMYHVLVATTDARTVTRFVKQ